MKQLRNILVAALVSLASLAGAAQPSRLAEEVDFKGWLNDRLDEAGAPEAQLDLTIDPTSFAKIGARRKRAMFDSYQFADGKFWVPVTLRYHGKTLKGKIRLKGDGPDHWVDGSGWSFRIKLDKKYTFKGMRVFTLQHPKTRYHLWEWISHQVVRREGLMALRYPYVPVTMNGQSWGMYAVEEGIDKHLVEYHQRREAPILKLDEYPLWEAAHHRRELPYPFWMVQPLRGNVRAADQWAIPDILFFNTKYTMGNPVLKAQAEMAKQRFEGFRMERLTASEVFDVEQMALMAALSELLGAEHNFGPNNVRLYFNPVTTRLEPIAFDMLGGGRHNRSLTSFSRKEGRIARYDAGRLMYLFNLTRDERFMRAYHRALEKVCAPGYVEEVIDAIKPGFFHYMQYLREINPNYDVHWEMLFRNRTIMRRRLLTMMKNNDQVYYPPGIHCSFERLEGKKLILKIANRTARPQEVTGMYWEFYNKRFDYKGAHTIPAGDPAKPLKYREYAFDIEDPKLWNAEMRYNLVVFYKQPGSNKIRNEGVFDVLPEHLEFDKSDPMRNARFPGEVEFLELAADGWRVKPGHWRIDKTIFVAGPEPILAGPGVSFTLAKNASLVFEAALKWTGEKDRPIVVKAEKDGGGILVERAQGRSTLEYVQFENLSNPRQGGWLNTGAVNFYEADVDLIHCSFKKNHCEDYLNIVRSDFSLVDSSFEDIFSDAFDGDFVTGLIRDTDFKRIGNDAIDFSGSKLDVQGLNVSQAGDKGISVGEGSHMTASEVIIKDAEIAVASKDLSVFTADGLSLNDCKVGFAVYQKKPEFGPGEVSATNVKMSRVKEEALHEDGSFLKINGKTRKNTSNGVKARLYGAEYGKKSK